MAGRFGQTASSHDSGGEEDEAENEGCMVEHDEGDGKCGCSPWRVGRKMTDE